MPPPPSDSSPSPRATVGEIARQSGYSKGTVSLALRGHPKIPAATRDKINRIAEELGYRPDPERSKLMAAISAPKVTGATLGFIRSGPTQEWDPIEKFFFDEIKKQCELNGYNLEPFWLFHPLVKPEKVNLTMWNRGVEGIVIPMIHPARYMQKVRTLPIQWEKFCVVEIADTLDSPKLNGIRHNHFGGMLRTLSELESLKYQRIGLCMISDLQMRTHHRWTAAYLLWKCNRGLSGELPMFFPEHYDPRAIVQWIRENRIDVVVSPGIEVLNMMRREGLRVPEDVGFATLHQWGEGSEHVTGINQNMEVQAKIAIDILISLIYRKAYGAPPAPIIATDPGVWRYGETTRKPGPGHQVSFLDNEPLDRRLLAGQS